MARGAEVDDGDSGRRGRRLHHRNSNNADWVCFSGLSERFRSDYVDHFAPLDPFLPHLNVARRWIKLSDCLPQSLLRQSEWYNDFILACGVRDILGTRLIETPSHLAMSAFTNRSDEVLVPMSSRR